MMTLKKEFPESHDDWRLLRVYVYYRLVLAILLVALFTASPAAPLMGSNNPKLFLISSVSYLMLTVSSLIFNKKFQSQPRIQAFFFILIDILVITLIMHANAGPTITK